MKMMIGSLAMVAWLGLVTVTSANAADKVDAAAELAKLEGTYVCESIEENGSPAPEKEFAAVKMLNFVIKGDTMTIKDKDEEKGAKVQKIEIDASKTPKHIDFIREFGNSKRVMLGIYSLDGKTLKICSDNLGKERPTEFTTKGKKAMSLIVLVRK